MQTLENFGDKFTINHNSDRDHDGKLGFFSRSSDFKINVEQQIVKSYC